MIDQEFLRKEIYATPFQGNTLVYAPLTRHVALYEGEVSLEDVDPEWLAVAVNPVNVPDFVIKNGFVYDAEKIRLRLNITSRCNLGCKYCSVNASACGSDMPMSVALAAVRELIARGKLLGSKKLEITFSGGEPTLLLDCIQEIVRFARTEVAGAGMELSLKILSNGFFPKQKVALLADLFQEIQISWDGDGDENPRYRSHPEIARQVWANVVDLLSIKKQVSVITVVSVENYLHLRKIVDQLYTVGVRHMFLALEDSLGRSTQRNAVLDYGRLAEIYLDLWREYRARGIEINLTGTDVHSISPFPCSVPMPNYSVAPNGTVSACTIAFNDFSERARLFQIGVLTDDRLDLDHEGMLAVRKYNVLNMDGCHECFAKWHCRGGCPFSRQRCWPDPLVSGRCGLIRTVVAEKVYAMVCDE